MSKFRHGAGGIAVVAGLAVLLSGCGYVLTYDDAFPPPPLRFPAFNPPDSVCFAMPEQPVVETVIMDADLYYEMHPPVRPIILAPTLPPRTHTAKAAVDTAVTDTVLAAADSAAVADSLAAADSLALSQDLPGVRVDLSSKLEQAYIARSDRDLAAARKLLSLLGKLKLTRDEKAQLQAVEGFVKRAEKALENSDYEGASNLAFKARTLAESLVESRP